TACIFLNNPMVQRVVYCFITSTPARIGYIVSTLTGRGHDVPEQQRCRCDRFVQWVLLLPVSFAQDLRERGTSGERPIPAPATRRGCRWCCRPRPDRHSPH